MAGELFRAVLCLGHQHAEASRTGDAQPLRLHEKGGSLGIIHHVQHALAMGEIPGMGGEGPGVRHHAQGGGVYEELGVPVEI